MAESNNSTTIDANEAAASAAYRLNEVIAIYPITPASPMGEFCDEWSVGKRPNLWGLVPDVAQLQSEAGAAGTVHGALQAGALTTTFTASQGLLLMIPNLYKIAGELNSFCLHVAARTLATHALSIFGDHSDVMACRGAGLTMLASNNVQEAHDLACIGQLATLASRVPVLHFFDGFRTSHELSKITLLSDDDLRHLVNEDHIAEHRQRALTPDRPMIRGTAQNPDVFFQAREACNPYYDACPDVVEQTMAQFAERTGRSYQLFEYEGDPQAEQVIVLMGSGCETVQETAAYLQQQGRRVGLVKVRLFRPFSAQHLIEALPASVKAVAVLDRTKEPGALGEPLFQDVFTAIREAEEAGLTQFADRPTIIGGRYGLSSKEFTPAMVKAVFDELEKDQPKRRFTIGIQDDVTGLSLNYDDAFDIESDDVVRAIFFGLGADGTVGANKNSIKIIGESTDLHVQGFFVYDSKKSGAQTVSHLRFGPRPIRSAYLIRKANFVACHQWTFVDRFEMLVQAEDNGVFLLNSPFGPEEVWDHLPREMQQRIIEKNLRFYVIDALKVASEAGMGGRINTVMQVCFFALAKVMDQELAVNQIKKAIKKTYQRKGDEVVRRNIAAVDSALAHLHQVKTPDQVTAVYDRPPLVSDQAPDFVQRITARMIQGQGDLLPVSAFVADGAWPTSTTQWEKRNIASQIPIWEENLCIQCNKCALVCPHAAIRAAAFEPDALSRAPETFRSVDYKAPDLRGLKYTIQVAPEDCTGCNLCVMACPAKDKSNPKRKAINMQPHAEHVAAERDNYAFFLDMPPVDRQRIGRMDAKGSQFLLPLFEYSGACAGCGETPYVKLLSQLFGDRALIANATGCSSIYGGNLPSTPWCTDAEGRGPAWSNSLFEDNAEFGFGFRLAVDHHHSQARELLKQLTPKLDEAVVNQCLNQMQSQEPDIEALRRSITQLRGELPGIDQRQARVLDQLIDYLAPKSVWLLGGDGWAYDIGYGGLDHVLASQRNVNILVLDTEVYSNTGGQQSKATPLGAAAKFAIAGKSVHKKDLGMMAMSYGHVYVASIALGANDNQTVKAFVEAESYPGPSLIIAYSHCIAHGYDLRYGLEQQKRAVSSGVWPLYRFDPRRTQEGQSPLQLDSGPVKTSVHEYMANEARFRMVEKIDPQRFKKLAKLAANYTKQRIELYKQFEQMHVQLAGHNGRSEATPKPKTEHHA